MSVAQERNRELIAQYGNSDADAGAAAVQIALMTARVRALTVHLQQHKKDISSRRGLLKLIGRRRRLQKYMQRRNPGAYAQLIKNLDLRR